MGRLGRDVDPDLSRASRPFDQHGRQTPRYRRMQHQVFRLSTKLMRYAIWNSTTHHAYDHEHFCSDTGRVKQLQKSEEGSLGNLVSKLLADALARYRSGSVEPHLNWNTKAMQARFNLADKETVNALLDGDPI